jgi:hypothetical protein
MFGAYSTHSFSACFSNQQVIFVGITLPGGTNKKHLLA